MIMACHCRFISFDKCSTLGVVGNGLRVICVDNRMCVMGQGLVYRISSHLLLNFAANLKLCQNCKISNFKIGLFLKRKYSNLDYILYYRHSNSKVPTGTFLRKTFPSYLFYLPPPLLSIWYIKERVSRVWSAVLSF